MRKWTKAGLIALSVLLGSAGVSAVAAPDRVSAKKKHSAPKIDAESFKKMLAALDKKSAEVEKQQSGLVAKLKESQTSLEKQLTEALAKPPASSVAAPAAEAPAAATAESAAPAEPPASAEPAPAEPPASTEPAPAEPPANAEPNVPASSPAPATNTPAADTSFEPSAALLEQFTKLSDEDEAFAALFSDKELEIAASLAERWLSLHKELDKISDTAQKLEASFDEYIKQKKYAEALKARNAQIDLDKSLNKAYNSLVTAEHLVSVTVNRAVSPDGETDGQKDKEDKEKEDKNKEDKDKEDKKDNKDNKDSDKQDDSDGDDDHHDGQHNQHDDGDRHDNRGGFRKDKKGR